VTIPTTDPLAAVARLRSAGRVLLTGHRSPDGDSIGSALALAALAERLGAVATILNRDPAPANLSRLPGAGRVAVGDALPAGFEDEFDLVVTVECPGLDRPGFDGLDRLPILNVDHHPSNVGYGEVCYLDPAAPAVGEMVWRMFTAAGLRPTADDATNLYVALTTDTGDFRYSNATARAFAAAAEMVEAGADPPTVSEWIHHGRTEASVRLLGEALATLELSCGGRLATVAVGETAFRRASATPADTEEIVNVPRAIAGVRAVALFKQWEPGTVRVSLRAKGGFDVQRIAAEYGGGGHVSAAGCTVRGDLAEVRSDITAAIERALGEEA